MCSFPHIHNPIPSPGFRNKEADDLFSKFSGVAMISLFVRFFFFFFGYIGRDGKNESVETNNGPEGVGLVN